MVSSEEVKNGLEKYVEHLKKVAGAFNEVAQEKSLPVRMNAEKAITAVKQGVGLGRVASFWNRADDTGIVHESQLRTAIDCFVELLADEKRCGHVVGAMQSGKTTTSLALQWAGPIMYLLKGLRAYPFYIIGNQTNHEDQTKTELDRFLAYYGNIELEIVEGTETGVCVDGMFEHSPTLATYREYVLRETFQDYLEVPQLGDLVHRRVGGNQGLQRIADLTQRATQNGYRPLMIIDEPQFGAGDRIVATERHKCVLAQIFDRIEQAIGATRDDHWFVGLSATPFELNDLERVWEVRQSLTEAYSGFNYFNGRPISPGVEVIPPITIGLTDFAKSVEIPFLANVSMSAYDGKPNVFSRHSQRVGYGKDQASYQKDMEDALRKMVYAVIDRYKEDPEPVGLCIRAFNDNARTQTLIVRLNLDPQRVEVIEYFGLDAVGMSVKRVIGRRKTKLPYIVFVTNRARMADAFPTQVRFFMDLALKASDLNALLQGLLGRACGYHKKSTVVLSDANAEIIKAYVATKGGYVHKTSRHSIAMGGYRRGAPTGMLKLRIELEDSVVKKFFEQIDAQVVAKNINPGTRKLGVSRSKRGEGFRTGPILLVAEALDLFEHIEKPEVRMELFPQIPTGFNVVRRSESVRHSRLGTLLTYSVDENGNCRYTFRWADRNEGAQGGAAGRAKGKKDSGDQHMEPTIYVEKYDPVTGETINDKSLPDDQQKPGNWRAFMVTFPLRVPVREIRAAEIALPVATSPYDSWMTPDETEARTKEERRRADKSNRNAL